LLQHPEQMQLLQRDPSLLPTAVEELLRYTAPVSLSDERWAGEDIVMHGEVIRKGDMVLISLMAANVDPQHFPSPEALELDRQEKQHLSFGKGIHYCLGAPLARLEGQTAFGTLLQHLPNLRLAADPAQLTWKQQSDVARPQKSASDVLDQFVGMVGEQWVCPVALLPFLQTGHAHFPFLTPLAAPVEYVCVPAPANSSNRSLLATMLHPPRQMAL
jgi:Cytochrome P450